MEEDDGIVMAQWWKSRKHLPEAAQNLKRQAFAAVARVQEEAPTVVAYYREAERRVLGRSKGRRGVES
ncbi:hypothetical protein PR202_ga27843 [Eleusine coracana subsp. coracana]|uniref:Uncharacterized protein n=1 Tax=Eleusine coracana subsp. coracana TaxID=191504 RepID=A0AAV5DHR0_ELECO|nr:hypothetical protein PR202_ga27843 [Eleusine coracana subsp. coracana]